MINKSKIYFIAAAAMGVFIAGFIAGTYVAPAPASAPDMSYRDALLKTSARMKNIKNDFENLKKDYNDAAVEIANLKLRAKPASKTIIKTVPADCDTCVKRYSFPIETDNIYRYCGTPDAFTEPLSVAIKKEYDRVIIEPYLSEITRLQMDLDQRPLYRPVRASLEVMGGYGLGGGFVMPSAMIETGREIEIGAGIAAPLMIDPLGDVSAQGLLMISVKKEWP